MVQGQSGLEFVLNGESLVNIIAVPCVFLNMIIAICLSYIGGQMSEALPHACFLMKH